jgi:hypothetical protein
VRYDAETYRLYGDLFQEAHIALHVKEASVGRAAAKEAPGFFRSLFGGGERASQKAYIKGLEEQGVRGEQALDDAAHRMGLIEADVAAQTSRATKAEELAAQRGESLGQFAKDPEALSKAQQSGKIWKGVGMGAAGLGAAGIPTAAYLGHQKGEEGKKRTRNLAFGAGAAAGLAAPQVIRGLGSIARGAGSTGLFPELQGYGEY